MEHIDLNDPLYVKQSLLEKSLNNKNCFDCGATYPSHVSINNGILICENCASVHKTLSHHVSYVRSLNDPWDKYLWYFMERGGNHQLSIFLERFFPVEITLQNPDITSVYNCPIEMRYKSVILDFYRKQLKSEVLMEELPAMPDYSILMNQCAIEEVSPNSRIINYMKALWFSCQIQK